MSDGLEIKVIAKDYAELRELCKTSDVAHCICPLGTSTWW